MSAPSKPESSTPDPSDTLPPDLRLLRRLVVTLTAVMILGLVTVIALLVIRLGTWSPGAAGDLPALPDGIILPEGARPQAVTFARDWLVVVDESGEILLFGRADGALRARLMPE